MREQQHSSPKRLERECSPSAKRNGLCQPWILYPTEMEIKTSLVRGKPTEFVTSRLVPKQQQECILYRKQTIAGNLEHQEGKNILRAEKWANWTDFPTCALTNRSTWRFQSVPSEHRQTQSFIKMDNIWGHMTNLRKFDLEELRSYRVWCPKSMGPNQRTRKISKRWDPKEHPHIIHWSERLERKEEYIELSESNKVPEFEVLRVICSTMKGKVSDPSSASHTETRKQQARRKDIIK